MLAPPMGVAEPIACWTQCKRMRVALSSARALATCRAPVPNRSIDHLDVAHCVTKHGRRSLSLALLIP
jgi:hypothetical protein